MRSLAIAMAVSLAGCASIDVASAPAFVRGDGVHLSSAEIDAEVTRLMEAGRVPGLAVALIAEGAVQYVRAYGYADIDEGRALEIDTVMAGASFTKSAFAYAVMTLVDEGRVDLDRPISAYLARSLPEYENYADLADDPRWRAWTPRMLLSHVSGMPNWRWLSDDDKLTILFEPGSRYAYSGEGIALMQFVLEEGLGIDVGALMQERVFNRFAMSRTSMTWREDFRPNFARGFDANGVNLGHPVRERAGAAGSMDTTIEDFAAFLAAIQRREGLSAAARAEMLRPQIAITSRTQFPTQFPVDTDENRDIALSYGLGWGLFQSPYGAAFFKEGHDDGWNNYALCLDEARRCIVLMANSSNGESIFLYIVDALMGETNLPWRWEGYIPYDLLD